MIPAHRPLFICPLIFTVTGLIAIGLLAIVGGATVLASVLAVLFVAPYVIKLRLPESITIQWLVRVTLYIGVLSFARKTDTYLPDDGPSAGIVLLGCLGASEMVMQCWRRTPAGRPAGMSLVFFAGIAYLGSCFINVTNLINFDFIKYVTPPFFLLMALSWRRIEAGTLHEPISRLAKSAYIIALCIAIAVGMSIRFVISANRDALDNIAQVVLKSAPASPEATGMSDSPFLGSAFGLPDSTAEVLVIHGNLADPHLRAVAFDMYSFGQWTPPASNRNFEQMPATIGVRTDGQSVIVVTKLLSASGLVYYPLDAGYLDVSQLKGARGAIDDGGPIYSAARTPLTYAFTDPDDGKDTLDPRETPTTLAKYLTVPLTIDSLVIRRAKTITSKCTSPWNKIEAICADLDSRHSYSQNYSAGPGDPVSDFILSKKPSYCEYFASAAVIMMRAVGIPARYVIGYYAHDHDNSGNTIVLQRDAHAWAEAYVNGTWITVDATPAGGRPDELYKPTLWQSISDTVADRIQMLRDRLTALGPVNIAVAAMLVIGVYFFVRIMLKELLSKRFKKTRSAGSRRFHSELGRRFANLLTKNKIVVPDGRTWLEYLKDAKELPIDRELALEFVDAYNQVRFGGMADNHLTEMLDMLEKTKK